MREIRVRGTGRFTGKPDVIEIIFALISESRNYEFTINNGNEMYNKLKQGLIDIGFKEDDLKTIEFSIKSVYDSISDSKGNYQSVFRGYLLLHRLKIEFDLDINRLGKILNIINKNNIDPELNINFRIKDKEKVKEAILKEAVNNARKNAEILSNASNVDLGEIILIDYNWSDIRITSPTRFDINELSQDKFFDITPEDVNVSDSVTVVWEIK